MSGGELYTRLQVNDLVAHAIVDAMNSPSPVNVELVKAANSVIEAWCEGSLTANLDLLPNPIAAIDGLRDAIAKVEGDVGLGVGSSESATEGSVAGDEQWKTRVVRSGKWEPHAPLYRAGTLVSYWNVPHRVIDAGEQGARLAALRPVAKATTAEGSAD